MLRRVFIGIGYSLLVVALLVVTILLVAIGIGYKFQGHKLVLRNGLVIFESNPSTATLTRDGSADKRKTPYRTTLEAGKYHFTISKPGYRSWNKTLEIVASQVTFAQYVLLVPEVPNVDALASPTTITAQAISRDHRHLAYIGDLDGAVYSIDTGSRQQAKIYSPHTPPGATGPEVLTSLEWSDDSSHLIITANIQTVAGAQRVTYVEAATGGDPVNLSTQYGFAFEGIKFAPAAWRQLYWVSPEGLRRLDLDTQSISGVLATDVRQINVTPDHLFYIQNTAVGKSLWSIDRGGKKQELIQGMSDSPSYSISAGVWRGNDYLAVVPTATHLATLYSGVYGNNPASQLISRSADSVSFSPDGHYLLTWQGAKVMTYDLDRSAVGQSATTYPFDWAAAPSTASWLDDSHIIAVIGGRLVLSEFDGANSMDLAEASPAITPVGVDVNHAILFARTNQGKVQVAELELH